ncbi:hypothetical protein RB2654_14720 [Rhodobacterales bacterium HTCC2654]|uniref:Uncharacterized protein n=1 Tax=Maritimibacter alkaliphilus HTCC2654 TaxID=314271 RepID=A3VGZ3_9RHOB|nr:hypothetical protein RB2654_14720 [Rhodobacterales bacterium HTCC2654] [Maritimibacter alkaliphilus HTCC2654]
MVAVDPGRRKIADPVEPIRPRRNRVAPFRQHRVAVLAGRGRDKHMCRLPDGLGHVGARPDKRFDPFVSQRLSLVLGSGGPDHPPALRDEDARQGAGREAVAEGKKRSGHGRDHLHLTPGCKVNPPAARWQA